MTPSDATPETGGGPRTGDWVLGNGTFRASRERMTWNSGGGVSLSARYVTETAPNGGVYARLATPIEDELLDVVDEAAREARAATRTAIEARYPRWAEFPEDDPIRVVLWLIDAAIPAEETP